MKGRCHTEWSQYWFCSHMTIKSLVWPYNSPRSGVTPVITGWVRTVLTDACLQPHTWPPATQNCHFLVQPLSFCLVFKAGAQQTLGSVRHTPCSAVPAGSCPAWDIPHLQWEGLWKVSLHEMLFYLLLKVVSDYTHSLPTVPSDHKCTEVPFLFHATTNPLITGTCKHKNKSKFQVLCFEKQSTNPQNSSTKPKTMHWNLTPKNILHFESIRVSPCED